ncbi:MAG: ATP phosphoribosyltransferase regulatory subunit [Deltaproteobacteria bacterium]|nr:ATP phosphoribosyltransferase regulatory subunit [Deltaproteobacteria bacterium]
MALSFRLKDIMANPSVISLPQGVRDILPEEAKKISAVEDAVLSVFGRYGFSKVITPLLEYVDALSLGMGASLKDRVLKFIDPSTGRVVAIRPDITPQIARVAATRMRDYGLPLRLCYNENVLRYQEPRDGKSREVLQLGAEFISETATPETDAEMICMAAESLKEIGLKGFKIDIGDIGFLRIILARLDVAETERARIKEAIAIKDASGLERILAPLGPQVSGADRSLLLNLTTFYGEEEVIRKAASFTKDASTLACLANLEAVAGIIAAKGYKDCVTIDLGEVRGFDYYTGIIFEGFASGIGKAILSGGRYDTLMERYGYPAAATGFAFDVENLVAALDRRF